MHQTKLTFMFMGEKEIFAQYSFDEEVLRAVNVEL